MVKNISGLKLKTIVIILMIMLLMFSRVSFANRSYFQKALRGLEGVQVIVGYNSRAELLGLSIGQITTDVELRLRKAGIRVLTNDERKNTPGKPSLSVIVTASPPAFGISVELKESIIIDRGIKTLATIWSINSIENIEGSIPKKVRESINDAVDFFINDYLAANPKK